MCRQSMERSVLSLCQPTTPRTSAPGGPGKMTFVTTNFEKTNFLKLLRMQLLFSLGSYCVFFAKKKEKIQPQVVIQAPGA